MFAAVALLAFVSSAIAGGPVPVTLSQCNTGKAQCCNSATAVSDPSTAQLLGLLGIVVQDVTAVVGLGCTPITVVGTGVDCSQKPLCCEDNKFNGLVNVGCSPISV